jgi:NADH:ubiquinone oxidoreductase subunit
MSSFLHRLSRLFTWWDRQTLNTQFYTWRFGEKVGEDEFGNIYYRKPGLDPTLGFERRWVIYAGTADGSLTPPGWYGWLHHTVDVSPMDESYKPREWELPHLPNMTGTPQAWRPPGSTLRDNARPPATGDYEAWSPGP